MAEILVESRRGSAPCEHLVQVYRDRLELAESVATYFASGFASDETAIAVATAAHWPVISERLERKGWPTAKLEQDGRLFVFGAEETLARISDGNTLSQRLFTELIGRLVDEAAATSATGRVRVFGEMVDLLVRWGDAEAADALEHMWNHLRTTRTFTLLCGYKVDMFERDSHVALLPQIYRSHSDVLPGADSERLESAIDAALREVLGEAGARKLYGQVERHLGDERIPLGQRALLWASAHMPRTAERVLASTHASYLAATQAA